MCNARNEGRFLATGTWPDRSMRNIHKKRSTGGRADQAWWRYISTESWSTVSLPMGNTLHRERPKFPKDSSGGNQNYPDVCGNPDVQTDSSACVVDVGVKDDGKKFRTDPTAVTDRHDLLTATTCAQKIHGYRAHIVTSCNALYVNAVCEAIVVT
ncbi:hypothetical protein Bbelb_249490 [Branchiostoma belcheri]|nr:hypothetical protein Bbelb_249490 [Branchiostoma belcheri]